MNPCIWSSSSDAPGGRKNLHAGVYSVGRVVWLCGMKYGIQHGLRCQCGDPLLTAHNECLTFFRHRQLAVAAILQHMF
jgi:hypothetical protein